MTGQRFRAIVSKCQLARRSTTDPGSACPHHQKAPICTGAYPRWCLHCACPVYAHTCVWVCGGGGGGAGGGGHLGLGAAHHGGHLAAEVAHDEDVNAGRPHTLHELVHLAVAGPGRDVVQVRQKVRLRSPPCPAATQQTRLPAGAPGLTDSTRLPRHAQSTGGQTTVA